MIIPGIYILHRGDLVIVKNPISFAHKRCSNKLNVNWNKKVLMLFYLELKMCNFLILETSISFSFQLYSHIHTKEKAKPISRWKWVPITRIEWKIYCTIIHRNNIHYAYIHRNGNNVYKGYSSIAETSRKALSLEVLFICSIKIDLLVIVSHLSLVCNYQAYKDETVGTYAWNVSALYRFCT